MNRITMLIAVMLLDRVLTGSYGEGARGGFSFGWNITARSSGV